MCDQLGIVFQEIHARAGIFQNSPDPIKPRKVDGSEAPVVPDLRVGPCTKQKSDEPFIFQNNAPAQRRGANVGDPVHSCPSFYSFDAAKLAVGPTHELNAPAHALRLANLVDVGATLQQQLCSFQGVLRITCIR
eukprot:Skav211110  [mRNA]  locus=scaffold3323:105529:106254:+ [translate_table: standard]